MGLAFPPHPVSGELGRGGEAPPPPAPGARLPGAGCRCPGLPPAPGENLPPSCSQAPATGAAGTGAPPGWARLRVADRPQPAADPSSVLTDPSRPRLAPLLPRAPLNLPGPPSPHLSSLSGGAGLGPPGAGAQAYLSTPRRSLNPSRRGDAREVPGVGGPLSGICGDRPQPASSPCDPSPTRDTFAGSCLGGVGSRTACEAPGRVWGCCAPPRVRAGASVPQPSSPHPSGLRLTP